MTLSWHMHMSRNSQQWYSRSHAGCLPALTYLFLSTLISSLTLFLFHLGHTVSHVTLEAFVLCYLYVCLKGSTVFLLSLLHSGLTCQKFSVYVDIFPGYYFCFHYDLYLLFLVIFHLTSMNSNSYSAPLLHMIFQHDILSHEYSVHTFSWSFSHPPL